MIVNHYVGKSYLVIRLTSRATALQCSCFIDNKTSFFICLTMCYRWVVNCVCIAVHLVFFLLQFFFASSIVLSRLGTLLFVVFSAVRAPLVRLSRGLHVAVVEKTIAGGRLVPALQRCGECPVATHACGLLQHAGRGSETISSRRRCSLAGS